MTTTQQQARWIRAFRWLHRKIAVTTFFIIFIMALTGLLLGIKKQSGLQAPTQKGVSADLSTWLPVDSLTLNAFRFLHDSVDKTLSTELDRIDIRPDKGIAKFVFINHYWSLQLDGTTGQLLSIERRNSDLIENIHDGSILDRVLGTGEGVKIIYSVGSGLCLLTLVISGYWLWFGPKRIRYLKRKSHS